MILLSHDICKDKKENAPKKIRIGKKGFLTFLCVLAGICALLVSPVFTIKNIEITEMEKYTKDEICEMVNIKEGMNMFLFNRFYAMKTLKSNTYIESAKISYKLPDTIAITIDERKVRGYVPYMGSYLYIDEEGRVLEVSSEMNRALPVVYGLNFSSFTLGEKIEAENKEAFDIMVNIAYLMSKYELLDMVVKIDVSNPDKILAYVNKVEVNLGDMSNGDRKIRTMAEVIKNINENDRGSLDLSDLSKPIIFKYLT